MSYSKLNPTYQNYIDQHEAFLQDRNLAPKTICSYKTYLVPFMHFAQNHSLLPEDMSPNLIRAFLRDLQRDRDLSDRSINHAISQIKDFYRYILHIELSTYDIPFRKFNMPLPYVPKKDVIKRFLNSLYEKKSYQAYTACCIMYSTGMRINEVCHLNCKDICYSRPLQNGEHPYILVRCTKNRTDRKVPLTETLYAIIVNYWISIPRNMRQNKWLFTQRRNPSNPMNAGWLQGVLLKTRKELGISEPLTAHTLRHAFGTECFRSGMSLPQLKELMGHKSIHSTLLYVHLTDVDMIKTPHLLDSLFSNEGR